MLAGLALSACSHKAADTGSAQAPVKAAAKAAAKAEAKGTAKEETPEPGSKGTVGVSLLTLSNPFFKDMGDAMVTEGARHGLKVLIEAGELDAKKQDSQVKEFIVKKCSAIILCPCDSHTVGATIDGANAAGIPVFTADIANLDKTGKVVCHVATDNFGGGQQAAKAIVEVLGGKGKIAIIDHPEVESSQQRVEGFKHDLEKEPGIEIVATPAGYGDREKSFKACQDLLQKHQDLDAIFAINDPTALGCVAAIEKAGRSGKVKVIGFDGMPEAKQAIKDGKIFADVVQHPEQIGLRVIALINDYLGGAHVVERELINASLYKKADADADSSLK
jgi:ribose transport system substrate-binding protein